MRLFLRHPRLQSSPRSMESMLLPTSRTLHTQRLLTRMQMQPTTACFTRRPSLRAAPQRAISPGADVWGKMHTSLLPRAFTNFINEGTFTLAQTRLLRSAMARASLSRMLRMLKVTSLKSLMVPLSISNSALAPSHQPIPPLPRLRRLQESSLQATQLLLSVRTMSSFLVTTSMVLDTKTLQSSVFSPSRASPH